MRRFHEVITRFDTPTEESEEKIVTDYDLFNKIILKSGDAQVMTIPIIGNYQIGKSSLIKLLTLDAEIIHGDGAKEQTTGALIYGPYLYNEIRTRFGMTKIDKNIHIYFIDTEGICGFRIGDDPTLNRLLLTQILAPYIAISPIGLLMHESNIPIEVSVYIQEFFNIVTQLTNNDKPLPLVNIVPNQPFRDKQDGKKINESDQYLNACQKLKEVISERFNGIDVSKFVALSGYNIDKDPLKQPSKFKNRFRYAAIDIIDSIEKARTSHFYDARGVVELFQYLHEHINEYDFTTLVQKAKLEAQFSTIERMFMPSVNMLIETKKKEIEEMYPKITNNSSDEERLTTMNIDINPTLSVALKELDGLDFPQAIREKCIKKFQSYVSKELLKFSSELNNIYMHELQERQKEFLVSKACSTINKVCSESMISLMESRQETIDIEELKECYAKVETDCDQTIEEYSRKFMIPDLTKNLVFEIIETNKQATKDKLRKCAKKTAENNQNRKEEQKKQSKEDTVSILNSVSTLLEGIGSFGVSLASMGGSISTLVKKK